jgi:hypothetical protein
LTLSHNHLSGEIPLWLQEKSMLHLDLSHNKLTGDLDGFKHQEAFNGSSISRQFSKESSHRTLILRVNRLSGDLPSSFGENSDLDILSGNLFGCDHLPKNDENSDSLSCGSEQYDQSLSLMGGVLGVTLCLVAMYRFLSMLISSFKVHDPKTKNDSLFLDGCCVRHQMSAPLQSNSRQSQAQIDSAPPNPLQTIFRFESLLFHLMWLVCVLTAGCLLFSLPVYVLKQLDQDSASEGEETQYITHTHMYNWLWTMAFVSGTTPAMVLMVAGFVCLLYFTAVMNRLGDNEKPLPPSLSALSTRPALLLSIKDDKVHLMRITIVWVVFFLNLAVVGTANGLYIWSTLLDLASDVRLWIQLSFALFSSLWSLVLRIGLPSHIKESRYGVWLFSCLNVMNSVLIPCAVTALSTPSCYQVSPWLRLG